MRIRLRNGRKLKEASAEDITEKKEKKKAEDFLRF